MDESKSSPDRAHPPPTTETRICPDCRGEAYVPIDVDYRPDTGRLVIVGGLCVRCRGEGAITVYVYGVKR